ncbi:MAG: zf-HC2 domain-containing protein [Gammaproteobacteria bacterium]
MQEPTHDLESLAAMVEGRLDDREKERVVAHLAGCPECRRTLAHLGRAVADGGLSQDTNHSGAGGFHWSNARIWLPVAASVLIGAFAWFQLAAPPGGERPAAEESGAGPAEDAPGEKRSGGRRVAGKTFRMASGEWIDASFDPTAGLPTVIARGGEERRAVLARVPELAPYTELGDRVLVVWQGTVYRFEP